MYFINLNEETFLFVKVFSKVSIKVEGSYRFGIIKKIQAMTSNIYILYEWIYYYKNGNKLVFHSSQCIIIQTFPNYNKTFLTYMPNQWTEHKRFLFSKTVGLIMNFM